MYFRTTWNLGACQTADCSAYHGMRLLGWELGGSKRRLKKCHFLTVQLIEASAAVSVFCAPIKYYVPFKRAVLHLMACRKRVRGLPSLWGGHLSVVRYGHLSSFKIYGRNELFKNL